ncbi:hypothetical protein Csa_002005 [Cucumis sativus]|nr:hypothetical protein Csa_002005 [Cucumis sativus]
MFFTSSSVSLSAISAVSPFPFSPLSAFLLFSPLLPLHPPIPIPIPIPTTSIPTTTILIPIDFLYSILFYPFHLFLGCSIMIVYSIGCLISLVKTLFYLYSLY